VSDARAAAILADAFSTDPVVTWFLRADAQRQAALSGLFTWMVEVRAANAGSVSVSPGGEAAAIWLRPDDEPRDTVLGLLRDLTGFVGLTGWRRLPRALAVKSTLERMHPKAPHRYLLAIGCRQDCQGKGHGGRLLAQTLHAVDAQGAAAYLESSNRANIPLYQRHGFDVMDEVRIGAHGPLIWPMWRPAR
jgi:ribosomal protein S18 acetylase RimI-like enzyme